jgi:hypothetical protein
MEDNHIAPGSVERLYARHQRSLWNQGSFWYDQWSSDSRHILKAVSQSSRTKNQNAMASTGITYIASHRPRARLRRRLPGAPGFEGRGTLAAN